MLDQLENYIQVPVVGGNAGNVTSDISISDVDTDDLSSDDAGDGNNDAGGDQQFSETL